MNNTQIGISNIVTAFDSFTIGSKVTNAPGFWTAAEAAVKAHDFTKDRIPGQGFLIVPEALPFVSAGDGFRTEDPADYIPALHRGQVDLFLRREKAGEVRFCGLVIYTIAAYLADPEVTKEEAGKLAGCTHVLVAVIASSGPESPLTPGRFVSNLAGGNREALVWAADEIRDRAKAIKAYWEKYAVVAG